MHSASETAQELSRVLDERTRALQQQLNCITETFAVVALR